MTFKEVFLNYYEKKIISNSCQLLSANLDFIYKLISSSLPPHEVGSIINLLLDKKTKDQRHLSNLW